VGPDAANLAGSLAKSLEVERSPKATQRASEIAQDQDAARFVNAIKPIKADGTDLLRRARLLQERERKRREMERRSPAPNQDELDDTEGEHGLDVMV
jgi:hypothetical protein